MVKSGDVGERFEMLKHYGGSGEFDMKCATTNMMWQLNRLGVGVKAGGLGVIIERKDIMDQGKEYLKSSYVLCPRKPLLE